jgi:hypothetical protein
MQQAMLDLVVKKVFIYLAGMRILAAGVAIVPMKIIAAIFAVDELFFG